MNQLVRKIWSPIVVRLSLSGLFVLLMSGCEQTQLPVGAELSISPESKTWNIQDRSDANGVCYIDPNVYVDQAIVLSLVSAEGAPLGHADISVYVDLAGNTSPFSFSPLALYDDRQGNNNGVIDDFELVSGNGDDIAIVKTDYYGGDRPLLLRLNVSCPYKGDVFAFSDGVSAVANIEVTLDQPTEEEEEEEAEEDVSS